MIGAFSQFAPSPLPPGDTERTGALIVFEGIDGSGKSTQAQMLAESLSALGLTVRRSMEPTGGEHGKALRQLWKEGGRHDPHAELELFRLDRIEHVETLIGPALRSGEVVILDRYYYSSVAYQGVRGIMDPQEIHEMMVQIAPRPDITFLLDFDPTEGLARITGLREETPNALEAHDNLVAVRAAFNAMTYPEIVTLNADQPAESLAAEVLQRSHAVLTALGLLNH